MLDVTTLKGWLADHEWRLSAAALAAAALYRLAPFTELPNPLGDSFQGISPATFVEVLAIAGLCLALRSQACSSLDLPGRATYRGTWFVLSWTVLVATVILASGENTILALVSMCAITTGIAASLTLAHSTGAGLVFTFTLFAASLLSTRGVPAQWWNPLYYAPRTPGYFAVCILFLAVAAMVYVSNLFGRRRF